MKISKSIELTRNIVYKLPNRICIFIHYKVNKTVCNSRGSFVNASEIKIY